jgi:hypothetical protein
MDPQPDPDSQRWLIRSFLHAMHRQSWPFLLKVGQGKVRRLVFRRQADFLPSFRNSYL